MYSNDRSHSLPVCADEGKHLPGAPEFCTLEAFRARVEELTPRDWAAECSPSGR
jgi:acid phosphatase